MEQWQGQQHLQSSSVSVMGEEPHHDDLMLTKPHQGGAMVTVERRDDILKHTAVTGGVVVIAMVVEASNIMKALQRKEQVNSMKCSIHP